MTAPDETEYDVIVIGAGPVGENVAKYATQGSGLTAALVEAELVGGECSYWACMPSKALLRPLEVGGASAHLGGLAGTTIDRAGLLARRDEWRSHLDDSGQVEWADSAGLAVVRGHGRLAGQRRVEVTAADGVRTLTARHAVVIATGSVPVVPDELVPAAPWVSRDATGVREVPERLAIVGGGVVACEAATWLAALGSRVTMLVRGGRLLAGAEPFASDAVAEGLRAAGVDIRFGVEVRAASREAVLAEPEVGRPHGGPVVLRLDADTDTLEVDEVLAATGRRPATDGLGLAELGVRPDDLDGGEELLPGWLYAVGDVGGGPKLTHWGKYRARVLGERIAARATGTAAPDDGPDAGAPPCPRSCSPRPRWRRSGRPPSRPGGRDAWCGWSTSP